MGGVWRDLLDVACFEAVGFACFMGGLCLVAANGDFGVWADCSTPGRRLYEPPWGGASHYTCPASASDGGHDDQRFDGWRRHDLREGPVRVAAFGYIDQHAIGGIFGSR